MYENHAMLSAGADARFGSAQLLSLVLCGALQANKNPEGKENHRPVAAIGASADPFWLQ
jgi:hypothetical protein